MSPDDHVRKLKDADAQREQRDERVRRAKQSYKVLIEWLRSPAAALIPEAMRGVLAEQAAMLVELAQLSHAKFDAYPFDIPRMQHQLDTLTGLTGQQE
jgi:hypothetical protein